MALIFTSPVGLEIFSRAPSSWQVDPKSLPFLQGTETHVQHNIIWGYMRDPTKLHLISPNGITDGRTETLW